MSGCRWEFDVIIEDPHLVVSELSSRMTLEGSGIDVQIYRLDFYPVWALEVISGGTSLIWDELFATDYEALSEFKKMAEVKGLAYILSQAEFETLH